MLRDPNFGEQAENLPSPDSQTRGASSHDQNRPGDPKADNPDAESAAIHVPAADEGNAPAVGKPSRASEEEASRLRSETVRNGRELGFFFVTMRGKRPTECDWPDLGHGDLDELLRIAAAGNIGVITGQKSGITVLDDDTELQNADDLLNLPPTATALTGGGHQHFYFKAPGEPIGNSTSQLADRVDVKGERGVVVAPGSIHPDTGEIYRWKRGCSPEEIEIAPLPLHIVEALRSKPKVEAPNAHRSTPRPAAWNQDPRALRYAEAALGHAYDSVSAAPEGSRNATLNKEAFGMGRFVAAGLLDKGLVEDQLSEAATQVGLESEETNATIQSGLQAGAKEPFDERELHDRDDSGVGGQGSPRHVEESDASAGSGGDPAGKRPRPTIMVEGGLLPNIIDEAERAILDDGGEALYQRGQLLVRAVRMPGGALTIFPVEVQYLVERMTRAARWQRMTDKGPVDIDAPVRMAKTYLARVGYWNVPRLEGVIEAPTLRPDGSFLSRPGYDAQTCLYLDADGLALPKLKEEPTRDDALEALSRLKDILKGFPFLEPCDLAAMLAAILTALVRAILRTAPLFAFRAPKMGSGKSLLADIVALILTGRVASVMSQGRDEDEDKKRLLAFLMEGERVACIDNIERPFGGSALCSILTQESYKDRVLGVSRTATVSTKVTWLATGNNLQIVGDLITRVVVCDLDPECERPEERVFKVNLHKYIPEHRGELVAAGLTILRAYHVAGRPSQGLPVFGRFEEWSGLIRSALVWAGEDDPCLGRHRLNRYDPAQMQIGAVLIAWRTVVGDTALTVAELIRRAISGGDGTDALLEALLDVSAKDGAPSPKRLGKWMAKHERRVEGGLRIERMPDRQGVAIWRVTSV